jgi:hypothetical protein
MRRGTLAWGAETGGRLSGADRAALALQGIATIVRERAGATAAALGLSRRAALSLLDEVRWPAGRIVSEMESLVDEASPPWLAAHCRRTFVFACLLAARDGARFDAEILALASLLHDLGITPAAAPPPGTCFAIAGAEVAREKLVRAGYDAGRADVVADAIALHLELVVHARHGAEARLLRAATALDIVGQGAWALSPELRAAVVDRHPRAALKRELDPVMRATARAAPETRIALYCGSLGMLSRIRAAPFAE